MTVHETTNDPSRWVRWADFGEAAARIRSERAACGEDLVVTDDHRKLLAHLFFELFPDGGDDVYMGVKGKRPFHNSSNLYDVADVLEWQVDQESGLSDQQKIKAVRLMSELPDVLNGLISDLSPQPDRTRHAVRDPFVGEPSSFFEN